MNNQSIICSQLSSNFGLSIENKTSVYIIQPPRTTKQGCCWVVLYSFNNSPAWFVTFIHFEHSNMLSDSDSVVFVIGRICVCWPNSISGFVQVLNSIEYCTRTFCTRLHSQKTRNTRQRRTSRRRTYTNTSNPNIVLALNICWMSSMPTRWGPVCRVHMFHQNLHSTVVHQSRFVLFVCVCVFDEESEREWDRTRE